MQDAGCGWLHDAGFRMQDAGLQELEKQKTQKYASLPDGPKGPADIYMYIYIYIIV